MSPIIQGILAQEDRSIHHSRLPPRSYRGRTKAAAAGSHRIYAFGNVVYADAFGVRRYTNYCMTMPFNPDGISRGIETYQQGNDAS